MRLNTVQKNVEEILKQHENAKNSLTNIFIFYQHQFNDEGFWFDLPFEAIARARRRLQSKYPSDKHIKQKQIREEIKYHSFYGRS